MQPAAGIMTLPSLGTSADCAYVSKSIIYQVHVHVLMYLTYCTYAALFTILLYEVLYVLFEVPCPCRGLGENYVIRPLP